MSNRIRTDRPDARRTVVALTVGTLIAVVAFAGSFVVRIADQTALADEIGTFAVLALLATPAVALVATAVELRRAQRVAAVMAVLVLLILAAATVLALLTR